MNKPNIPQTDERTVAEQTARILADLESNKTAAAQLRDGEIERLRAGGPAPIDLRSVPSEQWEQLLLHHVTVPPEIGASIDAQPIPPELVPSYEEAMERYHGVTPPYFLTMTPTLRRIGRAWAFVPELAPLVSGFILERE
ncbi:MAG: hypothetical protein QOE70_906 [Chthoniobacter sp.]|jgi:hypothetical protein|nr:hypothetical protein [Chthoniobacter sp.]